MLTKETEHWSIPLGKNASGIPELASRSLAMRRICQQLQQVNGTRLILIEGEAGTGKQLLARHLHALRSTEPSFVVEEATALFPPEGGLQSCVHPDPPASALERARQGCLMLRGVDELSSEQQAQLLRFIRSFETTIALGNSSAGPLPFQVICAARQALRARVLAGKFLPELYYRLSGVCFALPPLRERKEDIPGLARTFIDACARERRQPLQGLGPGALALLLHHRWPGNVRELESVIRAACFTAEGQWLRPIDLVILPIETVQSSARDLALPTDLSLDGVLRRHVQRVLKACDGNKARAATRLGISRSTLYRMLDCDSDCSVLVPEGNRSPDHEISKDAVPDQVSVS